MKSTDKVIYRNELEQEIEWSFFSVYFLKKMAESVDNEIIDNKPTGRDGYIFNSSSLGKREISIEGVIKINGNIDALERTLKTVCNPRLSGRLIFKSEKNEKVIDVRIERLIEFSRTKGVSNFIIDFISFDPYWKEVERTEYLALLSGRLTFPLVINKNKGILFGRRQSILETEIENIGDAATGFRVIFKAKGIVSNPEIENKKTGEKIKILVDMDKGDIVEVINQPTQKMVYINGVKSFKHLDRNNAEFFDLEVGKNLVGYSAELNAINLDVVVFYSPLYLGR